MELKELYSEIREFSATTHGSTDYDKDELFVRGEKTDEFAPFSYLKKKLESLEDKDGLVKQGFILEPFELFGSDNFKKWFEKQFSRKLTQKISKKINLLKHPNNKAIFDSIAQVHQSYEVLRNEQIIINGKNLPVQLGEWYAKCIFGLEQKKSTSQRGFDFYLDSKRVEVKIHWADISSPKGVKLRKSLVDMSDLCIVIYMARNFMIREICLLDSEFVIRKFSSKGHTIFLKDVDISTYFFSQSTKHLDKVVNSSALLKYSTPTFAMKIAENF